MNGETTGEVYKLLGDVTERLVVAIQQSPHQPYTPPLLEALRASIREAISATRARQADADALEGILEDLGVVRALQTVIALERLLEPPWWIEAVKGVIKYVKHLLPISPKLVSIIDEILELIDKILNWEKGEAVPPKPKPQPLPQPPKQPHPPLKEIHAKDIDELFRKTEELPDAPIGDDCQLIRYRAMPHRWLAKCAGSCPHKQKCELYIRVGPGTEIVLRCICA